MNLVYLAVNVLFLIWVLRNTLYWVFLWQLKEYRFDRVLIHLRDTDQGKKLLLSPLSIAKIITLLIFPAVAIKDSLLTPLEILVSLIFFYQFILVLKEASLRGVRRPVFTVKAFFLVGITLFSIIIFSLFPLFDKFVWLLILDRFLPFLVAFFVFFLSFPTEFYRDWKIEKAVKKMKKHKKVLVIGVTGSYGKSSTKDYLGQILEKKFNVLKTRGTNNTPIGIANTILSDLKDDTKIFIVEMGAYKKGEISEMCEMVKPKMGIITAVNNQHLSLFKKIENTMNAKYELIEALPRDGIGMFNANNDNSYVLFKKTRKHKVLYQTLSDSSIKKINAKDTILATNIVVKKKEIDFDVSINDKTIHLTAPFVGAQNIENVLPGIYIADHLGMKEEEIKKAVASLLPLPKTMILQTLQSGLNIIDDTFNANPDAALAAVNYMKTYKGKKIFVLQPMIELGKNANIEHYKVAKEISKACNYLLLTNHNFNEPITNGIKDGGGKCVVKVGTPNELSFFIKENTSRGDIVVFEGKEASLILNKII